MVTYYPNMTVSHKISFSIRQPPCHPAMWSWDLVKFERTLKSPRNPSVLLRQQYLSARKSINRSFGVHSWVIAARCISTVLCGLKLSIKINHCEIL